MVKVTPADRDAAIDLDELHIIQVWNIDRVAAAFAHHRQAAVEALIAENERLRQPKTVTFTVVSAADGNPMHTFKIDPTKKTILRPLHSMIGYVFEPEGDASVG